MDNLRRVHGALSFFVISKISVTSEKKMDAQGMSLDSTLNWFIILFLVVGESSTFYILHFFNHRVESQVMYPMNIQHSTSRQPCTLATTYRSWILTPDSRNKLVSMRSGFKSLVLGKREKNKPSCYHLPSTHKKFKLLSGLLV